MKPKRNSCHHNGSMTHHQAWQVHSNVSRVDFFLLRCSVSWTYAERQNIIKECYQEILYHLHGAVYYKRSDLWEAKHWQLHHDNAPTYSSKWFRLFWSSKHSLVRQAPYSLDMGPCDFWLFPKLKTTLKVRELSHKKTVFVLVQCLKCDDWTVHHSKRGRPTILTQ